MVVKVLNKSYFQFFHFLLLASQVAQIQLKSPTHFVHQPNWIICIMILLILIMKLGLFQINFVFSEYSKRILFFLVHNTVEDCRIYRKRAIRMAPVMMMKMMISSQYRKCWPICAKYPRWIKCMCCFVFFSFKSMPFEFGIQFMLMLDLFYWIYVVQTLDTLICNNAML